MMAYATLSQLRAQLSFEADNTADDTLLTEKLSAAQAIIEARTAKKFEATTAARTYDAILDVDGLKLNLDTDLLSITTLTNGDGTTIASADYVLLPANITPKRQIKLKISSGLYWTYTDDPEEAISVAGTWGYCTSAPADVTQATLRLAAYLYRAKDAQVFDEMTLPDGTAIRVPVGAMNLIRDLVVAYKELL